MNFKTVSGAALIVFLYVIVASPAAAFGAQVSPLEDGVAFVVFCSGDYCPSPSKATRNRIASDLRGVAGVLSAEVVDIASMRCSSSPSTPLTQDLGSQSIEHPARASVRAHLHGRALSDVYHEIRALADRERNVVGTLMVRDLQVPQGERASQVEWLRDRQTALGEELAFARRAERSFERQLLPLSASDGAETLVERATLLRAWLDARRKRLLFEMEEFRSLEMSIERGEVRSC